MTLHGGTVRGRLLASAASAPRSGHGSLAGGRARHGATGTLQSSMGIDTNVGPRGRCIATWCACAIAAGTSAARAGSTLHFT